MSLQATDIIVNGYFYTFLYLSKDGSVKNDEVPLIYCIGPSTKNINNFFGLNFHHLPEEFRETMLIKMNEAKRLIDRDDRYLFSETELNKFVPGSRAAVREYNRKRVMKAFRIPSTEISMHIYEDGRIASNEGNDRSRFLEDRMGKSKQRYK